MIDLRRITRTFPAQERKSPPLPVLSDITLRIPPGQYAAMVGASGSGKSTLMNILGCLDRPTSGVYRLHGRDVSSLPPDELAKVRGEEIGFVFQGFQLIPRLTAIENVMLPLILQGVSESERRARAEQLLLRVGLHSRMHHLPAALSGGQQQRVAIARALVTEPAIICLDEPLSNLDAKLRVQLRLELKKMQKDFGITSIYVTHDQEEALTLSDRIAVFNKGVIEQIGTPNEIYNHSATEFVCNFIGDINRLSDDIVEKLNAKGAQLDPTHHHYIRLERVHVNDAQHAESGAVSLSGTVESREYYGLYIKYYINVGSQTLKVIERNDGVHLHDTGDAVTVTVHPDDLMSYAPNGEEAEK